MREEVLREVELLGVLVPLTSDCEKAGSANKLVIERHRQTAVAEQGTERVPQRGFLQPPPEAIPFTLIVAETLDVARVFEAGDEFDLSKLDRLETACRREMESEFEEILRRHRLENVYLLNQHSLDGVNPLKEVPGSDGRALEHQVPDGRKLEQKHLEPELVDLVDDDEQQLVVSRRIRLQRLQ